MLPYIMAVSPPFLTLLQGKRAEIYADLPLGGVSAHSPMYAQRLSMSKPSSFHNHRTLTQMTPLAGATRFFYGDSKKKYARVVAILS